MADPSPHVRQLCHVSQCYQEQAVPLTPLACRNERLAFCPGYRSCTYALGTAQQARKAAA